MDRGLGPALLEGSSQRYLFLIGDLVPARRYGLRNHVLNLFRLLVGDFGKIRRDYTKKMVPLYPAAGTPRR